MTWDGVTSSCSFTTFLMFVNGEYVGWTGTNEFTYTFTSLKQNTSYVFSVHTWSFPDKHGTISSVRARTSVCITTPRINKQQH